MTGFKGTRDGVTAVFDRREAVVVRGLVGQVVELVVADLPTPDAGSLAAMIGISDGAEEPDDPVLARLLPDGYRDDPDAAREFRRFTESGLRTAKVECAQTVLATLPAAGGEVSLTQDQAEAWLRSLNDVRLALGVRLGITEDDAELDDGSPDDDIRYAYIMLYHWLTDLQGSLVAALS